MTKNNDINIEYNEILKDSRFANMVKCISRDYWQLSYKCVTYRSIDEFYQAALIGLWKALKKKDNSKGDRFLKFARNKIKWECSDYLRTLIKRNKKTRLESASLENISARIIPEFRINEYLPKNDPRIEILEGYYIYGHSIKEMAKKHKISKQEMQETILNALNDAKEYINGRY